MSVYGAFLGVVIYVLASFALVATCGLIIAIGRSNRRARHEAEGELARIRRNRPTGPPWHRGR